MAYGDFINKRGEYCNIDLLPIDGKVRVRMVIRRGEGVAMYSDYFDSYERAGTWAQDICIVYGEFQQDDHICERCGSPIFPWEGVHETELPPYGQYHISCWHDE